MCDELTEQNLYPLTGGSPSFLQTSLVYHLCSQMVSKDPRAFYLSVWIVDSLLASQGFPPCSSLMALPALPLLRQAVTISVLQALDHFIP